MNGTERIQIQTMVWSDKSSIWNVVHCFYELMIEW